MKFIFSCFRYTIWFVFGCKPSLSLPTLYVDNIIHVTRICVHIVSVIIATAREWFTQPNQLQRKLDFFTATLFMASNLLGHLWPQDKILDTYFPLWSILYIWEILDRQDSRKSLDNWSSALGVREAPYLTSPPTKDLGATGPPWTITMIKEWKQRIYDSIKKEERKVIRAITRWWRSIWRRKGGGGEERGETSVPVTGGPLPVLQSELRQSFCGEASPIVRSCTAQCTLGISNSEFEPICSVCPPGRHIPTSLPSLCGPLPCPLHALCF